MKLPQVSGKGVVKALAKIGFEIVGQKGSHCRMKRGKISAKDPPRMVIIPMHRKLAKGTLRNIIRRAGLTREEFIELL